MCLNFCFCSLTNKIMKCNIIWLHTCIILMIISYYSAITCSKGRHKYVSLFDEKEKTYHRLNPALLLYACVNTDCTYTDSTYIAVCLLTVGGLFMWLLLPTLMKHIPGEESDNRNTQMVADKTFSPERLVSLGLWCFYMCVAILWIWTEKSLIHSILMKIHRLYRHCRE